MSGQNSAKNGQVPRQLTARPPHISRLLLAGFHEIAQRRLKHAFRALRIANRVRVPLCTEPSLIVVLNHPSWWDPLTGFVLSRQLFPARHFYAPMDAAALERYRIFRRLGLFPVALNSPRGALQFLRTANAVLDAGHILAATPQGHFTDVRVRPVQLQNGLAALLQRRAAQGKGATVLPLALEYTFWDQRLPEALVNCGEPLRFGQDTAKDGMDQRGIQTALETSLERAQDELAALSLLRDPQKFTSLLEGKQGSAGFYSIVERARALLGGNRERGDHRSGSLPANTGTGSRNP